MCATVPLWLLKNLTAHISWFLFQGESKCSTSEASNIWYVFPQELKGGQVKSADFQDFAHHEPQAGFPVVMSTGLQREHPPLASLPELLTWGRFRCTPQPMQGPRLGHRQTPRVVTPGSSARLVHPGQNNQNSLENLKLQKYAVHFQNFEMKHSFHQPDTWTTA